MQIKRSDLKPESTVTLHLHYMRMVWNMPRLRIFTCKSSGELLIWEGSKTFYGPFENEVGLKTWIRDQVK